MLQTSIRTETTVLPGHRVEISDPALPEGAEVEVVVTLSQKRAKKQSMLDFLAALPPGPRAFPTWEEYERHLREEKESWVLS